MQSEKNHINGRASDRVSFLTSSTSSVCIHDTQSTANIFRNDRNLFADVSRLIFSILKEFYKEAARKTIQTGMGIAHQSFDDMLRWNPHFHCIVLDGGFDEGMDFIYIPFSDLKKKTEFFAGRLLPCF